jgi:hypothetical protein
VDDPVELQRKLRDYDKLADKGVRSNLRVDPATVVANSLAGALRSSAAAVCLEAWASLPADQRQGTLSKMLDMAGISEQQLKHRAQAAAQYQQHGMPDLGELLTSAVARRR